MIKSVILLLGVVIIPQGGGGEKQVIGDILGTFLPPVLLGSILYQSATLAYMYYEGAFLEGFLIKLSTRSVQFGITLVIDVAVIYLLMRTNVFTRMGIWPPKKEK